MIERFKQILEELKLSPSEFADRIGVQRSNISHILSGRNKPGLDFLEKMLNVFPDVDISWLITGKQGKKKNNKEELPFNMEPESAVNNPAGALPGPVKNKTLPLPVEEAVDHIIIVYKNDTFRILKPTGEVIH
jgi:transcriptional regulator with XRE-family HTH domain